MIAPMQCAALVVSLVLGMWPLLRPAAAQTPQLLVDGNPLPGVSSNPTSFGRGPTDGTVWLAFDDGVHGTQLWLSDATAAGTVRVTGFPPGAIFRWTFTMADLAVFVVERSAITELWRTDGTPAGTILLHTATPTSGFTYPTADVAHGSVLWFADGGSTWRTDGTPAGTFPLGVPSATWKAPFLASTLLYGFHGELIVSDGTTAAIVGNVPGDLILTPDWGAYQSTLQFGPTGIVVTLTALHVPGAPNLVVSGIPRVVPLPGQALLIASSTGLVRWDGLSPAQSLLAWTSLSNTFMQWGPSWVFAASQPGTGNELVFSDGTLAGTTTLDLVPGPAGSDPQPVAALASRFVFWADTGGLGSEPHATDGTLAGSFRLGDLEPGPAGSSVGGATAMGERRVVMAVQTTQLGKEPWLTDGTVAGTTLLADIAPGPASSLITPGGFWWTVGVLAGDALVFMANDGVHGREPWVLPLPGSRASLQRYGTRRFDVGDPVLGTSTGLRASGLAPSDLGVVVVGTPRGACLPIAQRRCVHVDPPGASIVAIVTGSPVGEWTGSLTLPNQPAAIGLDLVVQALFVESSQPLGFDVGDAHWWSLGS